MHKFYRLQTLSKNVRLKKKLSTKISLELANSAGTNSWLDESTDCEYDLPVCCRELKTMSAIKACRSNRMCSKINNFKFQVSTI